MIYNDYSFVCDLFPLQKIEKLGAKVVTQINQCTHLVAAKVTRTMKFLCGVSVCRYILTPQWVEESHKNKWLLGKILYKH